MPTIYTRRGDAGMTGLYTPKGAEKRVSKDSVRVEAYGSVDELNAHLGHLASLVKDAGIQREVEGIQSVLFHVGYDLAALGDPPPAKVVDEDVRFLERRIDAMTAELKPLRAFILPSGGAASSFAHVARTVCRRAERRAIRLAEEAKVNPVSLAYLNRLSDYLFTLARYLARGDEVQVVWRS